MNLLLDTHNIALLVTVSLNFVLALIVYLNGREEKINRVYLWNILAIIAWIVGMFIYRSAPPSSSLFWCRLLYVAPTFIASSFLYFTYIFPSQEEKRLWVKKILIFATNLFIVILVLIPGLVIKDVNIIPGKEKEIVFTSWYVIYVVYTISFFTYGFIRIIKKYLRLRKKESKRSQTKKVQIVYLFVGYALAANLAFITNLIMPWLGYFFLNWLGQVFTVFMVAFTVYGILRHNLFRVRLALSEFLVTIFSALLLLNIFTSSHVVGYIWKTFLFLLFLLLGGAFVRSVLKEIETYDQVKKYAEQLKKANARLKQLNKHKTEFMSFAAHQLRSPLTSVKAFASLILQGSLGKPSKKVEAVTQKIHDASDAMAESVEDYLNITRIEQGRMDYNMKELDAHDLAQGVVEELRANAYNKDLKLELSSDKYKKYSVQADRSKLRQIIGNFVDNAIKYTQEGEVKVRVEKKDGKVRILVSDTGMGMSEETIKKLFQRYSRADDTQGISGTGLGLYIARKMIEAQHGKVWAESPGEGRGSIFYIELPEANEGGRKERKDKKKKKTKSSRKTQKTKKAKKNS